MMNTNTLYVAYGSNLNIKQMSQRCPTAEVYGTGRILDYRLTFKTLGVYAYATIEPCVGEYVPVAVWKIGERDERNLDRYEGFPTLYEKQTLEVVLDGGAVAECMVYIMNSKADYALPAQVYLDCVLSGYRSFHLDVQKVYEAWHRVSRDLDTGFSILKYYREKKGLTQTQLAEKTGISLRNIQKYESGERSVQRARGYTILRLAQALEVSPYLLAN